LSGTLFVIGLIGGLGGSQDQEEMLLGKFLIILSLTLRVNCKASDEETLAKKYVDDIMLKYQNMLNSLVQTDWNYESSISDETLKLKNEAQLKYASSIKEIASNLEKFNIKNFKDEDLKRKIMKLTDLGDSKLPEAKLKRINHCKTEMTRKYSTAKVPSFKDPSKRVGLEPDLLNIFATSRNPDELKHYWTQWYDNAGTINKDMFWEYVSLRNESAHANSKFLLFLPIGDEKLKSPGNSSCS
jgi:peptidyl-dipeptidase A